MMMNHRFSYYWSRLILLISVVSLFSIAYAIPHSALKPELNYLPTSSFLQENYTDAPPEQFVEVQDSVFWTAPVVDWSQFWYFWKQSFGGNDRQYSVSQYALNNDKLNFVSRFHFLWGYEAVQHKDANYGFLHMMYHNQAYINKDWYIYGETWFGNYFGDKAAAENDSTGSPLLDTWHKQKEGNLANQNFTGGICYNKADWFSAELGRGRFSLGNNISSSIILSDLTNDYAFTKLEIVLGKVNFTLLNGSLIADSVITIAGNPTQSRKNYPDKYISVHYMSWPMWKKMTMYTGDIVIYGNRAFDWNYLFPHSFVRAVERNQHDRDNAFMYGGADWKPKDDVLLYAQIMLDEFIATKIAGDWWGNKYAVQGGMSYRLPKISKNADKPTLAAELTAIRPWTYTHNYMVNKYSHDNRCLGYQYGTNLINLATRIQFPLDRWSDFTGYYSFTRQGSEGNIYALNYGDEIDDLQNTEAKWLGGRITNTYRIEHSLKLHPWAHQRFRLTHNLEKSGSGDWFQEFIIAWQMII